MKRILLLLAFVFAVNLFAYSYAIEIEEREPDYIFSVDGYGYIPVYLGFSPSTPDSLGIVKIKSPNHFTSIKVDGREVKSFNSSVAEAEINLASYTSVYLEEVAHILEIYNEESRSGRLYFGSQLSEKGGCRLFCPYDISKATVLGFSPGVNDIYVPEEYWVNEEWCMPVVSIDKNAFLNDSFMESIKIPSTLEWIGNNAFIGCTNLKQVVLENSPNPIVVPNAHMVDLFQDAPLESIYFGRLFSYKDGGEFSPIKNKTSLESVAFGSDNMELPWNMFQGCTSLKSIIIPENVSIRPNYDPTHYSYKTPDGGIFADCTSLEEVEILSPMTSTNIGMFHMCTSLKTIKLPTEIEMIAPWTFSNCYELSDIPNFPNLKRIGESAFRNCQGLENVVLPESVTVICGNYSFGWCSNLKSIVLPPNIEQIGLMAFDWCRSLNEVTYNTDNPKEFDYSHDLFIDCPSTRILYVPGKSIDKFKEIRPWMSFSKILPIPVATQSVSLNVSECKINDGEQFQLQAIVMPEDATDELIWTSDNENIVSVDSVGLVTAISVGDAVVSVKSGDFTASCNVSVVPTLAEGIILGMDSVNLKVGETINVEATVLPENTTDKTIVWESSDSTVATVNETGEIKAVSIGTTVITATCGMVSATCEVTVIPTPVESISIGYDSINLQVGESIMLIASVSPEDATDKTVVWTSDNESVAYVDEYGNVTAMSIGTATITASCGDVSASCIVTVIATPAESISLSQESAQLKVGESLTLTARVLPEDAADKTVVWTSDNSMVAYVDEYGNVTAMSLGTATIIASCGEVSAYCIVEVVATPAESISLSQESAQLKVGESLTLTATVLPEDATDKTVVWTSDNSMVTYVDEYGNVTAMSLGTATITASCGDVSASCSVEVVATPVESISLSQESAQLKVGENLTLIATVLPEDASDKTIVWTSDNTEVATVDEYGNVTAKSVGTSTIIASCGDVNAYCMVEVVATPVESISLSQELAQLKVGEILTLTATVLPEDATDKTVIWASDNSMVAYVDEYGNVSAMSLGTATITASSGDVRAYCMVEVVATPVESISLSQESAQLIIGENLTLTATVYPENATDKALWWSSSDESVATVDSEGYVTAISVGEADIVATAADGSGISAVCYVTVNPVLVEAILLTPDSWSGEEGESFKIEATVLPENATDKALWWSSSEDSVATVDSEGNVSVLKEGSCVITATAADGSGIFAECIVTGLSGIDVIFTNDNSSCDVYDMNGLLLKKESSKDDLKKLTPGIYILRRGATSVRLVIR